MAKVLAVCTSEKKGVQKVNVSEGLLIENHGLQGDAHAGNWHRQVSLLSDSKIQAFNARGANVAYGAFGENLVADLDFGSMPVGTLLRAGEALLEITQIGKACHHGCAIFQKMGDCIMPREGVFARVLRGGTVKVGDVIEIVPRVGKRPYQAAVITLSDKGARGEREDLVRPVADEDAVGGRPVELRERRAEVDAFGGRITAEILGVEFLQDGHRLRGRQVGGLVRVELDDVTSPRLFAVNVGSELADFPCDSHFFSPKPAATFRIRQSRRIALPKQLK